MDMSLPLEDVGSYRAIEARVCFGYFPNQDAFASEDDAINNHARRGLNGDCAGICDHFSIRACGRHFSRGYG